MPVITEPWTRVRAPVPIPHPLTSDELLRLSNVQYAELLRSNLTPRTEAGQRRAWDALWQLLRADDDLADRTYDVLDDFLDTTQTARDAGTLDEAALTRTAKFADQCQKAWNRLERADRRRREPLAWAPHLAALPPESRHIIATLTGAIARHRGHVLNSHEAVRPADRVLWDTLRALNLDPRDHHPLPSS